MTFTAGCPFDGQTLGASKPQVRGNFTNYFNTISTNHVAPGTSGQGKHTFAEFVEQAQAPATSIDESAIYSRLANGQSQLFCQKENQAANQPDVQLTRFDKGIVSGTNGYTFIAGGILIQWGQAAFVGNQQTLAVSFPTAFASDPSCYNVQVTMIGFGNSGAAQSNTAIGFTAVRADTSHSGQQIWWVAIGT